VAPTSNHRLAVATAICAILVAALLPAAGRAATRDEGPSGEGWSPVEVHAAYLLPFETPSANAGLPPESQPIVALIDAGGDPTLEEDLEIYSRGFGLPACTEANGCLRVVNAEGNPAPLPEHHPRAGETELDVEMVHATCPTCRILVVEGVDDGRLMTTTGEEVETAARLGATSASISIELYSADTEGEEEEFLEELEEEFFTQPGMVITAAAGDCGYDDGAATDGLPNEIGCKATPSLYPAYPAKLGNVISVGGTNLTETGGVWKSTAWVDGGSGCAEAIATPAWQAGLPNWAETGCGGRAVADVSADASCQTGIETYDPWELPVDEAWSASCGTSAASPIVAAEFALAGGARGVDLPARTLYEHAGESDSFYDVTEGTNGSCPRPIECNAGPGYDEPTGLGSPIGLHAFALPGAPRGERPPTISGAAQVGGALTVGAGTAGKSAAGYL
jgi:subtilase family serine protease